MANLFSLVFVLSLLVLAVLLTYGFTYVYSPYGGVEVGCDDFMAQSEFVEMPCGDVGDPVPSERGFSFYVSNLPPRINHVHYRLDGLRMDLRVNVSDYSNEIMGFVWISDDVASRHLETEKYYGDFEVFLIYEIQHEFPNVKGFHTAYAILWDDMGGISVFSFNVEVDRGAIVTSYHERVYNFGDFCVEVEA